MRRKTGRPFHRTARIAGASSALPPRNQKSGQISQICVRGLCHTRLDISISWGFVDWLSTAPRPHQQNPRIRFLATLDTPAPERISVRFGHFPPSKDAKRMQALLSILKRYPFVRPAPVLSALPPRSPLSSTNVLRSRTSSIPRKKKPGDKPPALGDSTNATMDNIPQAHTTKFEPSHVNA